TGVALRNQARHLDRNHDIISGGLSTLVQNIIGPSGINIVPTPRDVDGNLMPSSPSTTPGPSALKSPGCTTGPASSAELDRWKHAVGDEVRGLVLRRADERALCEGRAS
ncbi:phage portal protein, partial [Xylella fastidiosa subsp. pauca]|uniref:phage portal protein n=1 Tax=Xylella fastidiosa TaxID=2371 RepID=UPI00241E4D5A